MPLRHHQYTFKKIYNRISTDSHASTTALILSKFTRPAMFGHGKKSDATDGARRFGIKTENGKRKVLLGYIVTISGVWVKETAPCVFVRRQAFDCFFVFYFFLCQAHQGSLYIGL